MDIAWGIIVHLFRILFWGYFIHLTVGWGCSNVGFPASFFSHFNFDSHTCYGYFQLLFVFIIMVEFDLTIFISFAKYLLFFVSFKIAEKKVFC